MKRLLSLWAVAGAMFSLLLLLGSYTTAAADPPPLYSFDGTKGAIPYGSLIQASDGNFYGTATQYGSDGYGTVFKLTTNGTAAGTTLTTLVNFNGTNGGFPNGALIQGRDGNFYGTTYMGGSSGPYYGSGTVFKLTTDGTAAGTTLTTLLSFNGTNGANPSASLIQASDGNFYGTTAGGGSSGRGTVFKLTTDGTAAGTTLTTLASFNGPNGASPNAAVIQASDGNFYGTTARGGSSGPYYDYGTVFKLTTDGTAAGTTLTTLLNFNYVDGAYPYAALIQGRDGNFYGTSSYGGNDGDGYGTVFKLTTDGTADGTIRTTLVDFNSYNGASPSTALIQTSDGNFYGTSGTSGTGGYGSGTVFKLTTDGTEDGTTLTTLLSFNSAGGINGANPNAALLQGRDRKFYGITSHGGLYGGGTVFLIDPRALQSVTCTPMTVASNTSAIGEVTLSHIATFNVTVTLTSSNPAVLPIRSSVTITPGHRHALFAVSPKKVTKLTRVTITATLNGVSKYSRVVITP